jgi:hypothetical protein
MAGHHWVILVIVFVIALFLQQKLNLLGMVGMG